MTVCRPWFGVLFLSAACGSVAVPVERCYRLELPSLSAPDPQRAGVLRVHDLQLGTALDSDCLQRQEGLRMVPQPLARWVAPLDRLVTDALVLGLSRARVCNLVKGAADPGAQTWALHGRIVEFAEGRGSKGSEARVALELWLEGEQGLVFHDDFTVVEPMLAAGEESAVLALSRALQQVVTQVVWRLRGEGLLAAARTAAIPTAAPAR